ncbi:hypothetical protein EVAR_51497_1 [Eumeta japonica]|uniref:Uncharacterized protein n=1 Tax=Eumeta variegata TaxID=151549 RepID=A0A4C1XER4_EUMVA|nr:hypothetical protein EVAR_51497_1 [Eumeta japonica]
MVLVSTYHLALYSSTTNGLYVYTAYGSLTFPVRVWVVRGLTSAQEVGEIDDDDGEGSRDSSLAISRERLSFDCIKWRTYDGDCRRCARRGAGEGARSWSGRGSDNV